MKKFIYTVLVFMLFCICGCGQQKKNDQFTYLEKCDLGQLNGSYLYVDNDSDLVYLDVFKTAFTRLYNQDGSPRTLEQCKQEENDNLVSFTYVGESQIGYLYMDNDTKVLYLYKLKTDFTPLYDANGNIRTMEDGKDIEDIVNFEYQGTTDNGGIYKETNTQVLYLYKPKTSFVPI